MEEINMLIPHLHFGGNCREAIDLYEKAFSTKVEAESIDYISDSKKIAHAAMNIHRQKVFLNDNFGNKNKSLDCGAVHLIITFNTTDELLACYEILKTDDNNIYPFNETPYSKLVGNFMDKFGVLWGFMITA
jgi:PhnB protein